MRANSFRCQKMANGDYEYVVKFDEFVLVQHWYELRGKRLNSLFAKDPANAEAARIWKRSQVDFGEADKMYNLSKHNTLRFE